MHSCDESLFLALNFDGGPCLDRIMTLISGMAIWIPFYLLILWLVCRRYGWRNTLLFLAALALALVLSDMLCGIFKHSGPLNTFGPIFLPAGVRCSLRPSKDSTFRPTRSSPGGMPGSPHRTASYTFPPEPSPGNTAPYPPTPRRSRQSS